MHPYSSIDTTTGWKKLPFILLVRSWGQYQTKHQLYGLLPPITKTILVRRTRYAGHCRRSRDKLINDVLLWTPTNGRAKAGRPAWKYIQQLYEDTGCSPEDLPEAMNNWEKWRERVRDSRAGGTTWWWWWWWWWWKSSTFIMYYKVVYRTLALWLECSPRALEIWVPKTQTMVLDVSLLNTQHYKLWYRGKVDQSWEWSNALLYT